MKIWIDLTNSPHVNFFAGLIDDLKAEHEVLLTCRPLANTIELLKIKGFTYHIVGKHYGASKAKKAFGFLIRVFQLFLFLRKKKVEVAISHSSFYSPIVARMLGARSIYLNDNEHAAGNRISFLFADKVVIPECISSRKIQGQWCIKGKIIRYPGVKEGIYLWNYKSQFSESSYHSRGMKKTIFIRPEPRTAQYYKGGKNFIDDLLVDLKDDFEVTLLPRGEDKRIHYTQGKFQGIVVPQESMTLAQIMDSCDLFIGAGGTMTREAAVLGIPTISIYQDELLEVDKYLIEMGRMIYKPDIDKDFVVRFIKTSQRVSPNGDLLVKGKKAYDLIKDTLLE